MLFLLPRCSDSGPFSIPLGIIDRLLAHYTVTEHKKMKLTDIGNISPNTSMDAKSTSYKR